MLIRQVGPQAGRLAFALHPIPLQLAAATHGFLLGNELAELPGLVFEL